MGNDAALSVLLGSLAGGSRLWILVARVILRSRLSVLSFSCISQNTNTCRLAASFPGRWLSQTLSCQVKAHLCLPALRLPWVFSLVGHMGLGDRQWARNSTLVPLPVTCTDSSVPESTACAQCCANSCTRMTSPTPQRSWTMQYRVSHCRQGSRSTECRKQ